MVDSHNSRSLRRKYKLKRERKFEIELLYMSKRVLNIYFIDLNPCKFRSNIFFVLRPDCMFQRVKRKKQ